MGADAPGIATVEHGGMTVTSTDTTAKAMKAELVQSDQSAEGAEAKPEKAPKEKRTITDSARELGERGGKVAAEKRAAEAKEKPAEVPAQEARAGEADGEELPDEKLTERQRRRVEVATRKQAEATRALQAREREFQAERQRYEAELAAHRVRGGQERPQAEGQPDRERPQRDASEKPRADDYDNYDEYLDARDNWNRGEWSRESERRQYAEKAVETFKGHVETARKHWTPEAFEATDPELIEADPYFTLPYGAPLKADNLITAELFFAGERGPAMGKYLTEHPEELQRIRALRTSEDIRVEMLVLARSLGSKADATSGDPPANGDRPPKVETSRARPPVQPVTGAPYIADRDAAPREDEANDFDAWLRRTGRQSAGQR